MYSPCPRPILKRHDPSSSPPNHTSHINNTAANTLSNSHYSHYPSPRSYAQNHHNYAPHNGIPNHTTPPMPIIPNSTSNSRASASRSCTVRFPPSPALTSTFACHSSTVYDRSPIVVAPNTCALPERGCPGRTYALGGEEAEEEADEYDNCVSTSPKKEKRKTKTARDRDFHPRALAFAQAAAATSSSPPSSPSFGPSGGSSSSSFALPPAAMTPTSSYTSVSLSATYYNYDHAPMPALVHDLSSESDESDGISGLPAQITGYMSALSLSMSVSPTKSLQIALECTEERDGRKEKAHRRHRSRERASRHERSSDPDRIPGLASAVPSSPIISFASPAPSASPFSSSSSPPSFVSASPPSYCSSNASPRKKGVRRSYPAATGSLGLGCGGFGAQEEGCLGGF
ncbi:hypothetical protein D9619_011756 [Psilocybe cf. subviscida]|uniref:Uncharacterized protein n=1 Tax=Psilocybe cf. subviscida TaxID=2480587 RepID=A0A8H5B0E8_9AGAR|nr:hypothetical protein D9619_011756 [Psilocybe cf. subviscida]